MEASEAVPSAAPAAVDQIHDLFTQAGDLYHQLFDGHVPDEHARFDAFLATVRMIVDQSADRVGKGD